MLVRCDKGDGWLRVITVEIQPFVISRCDDNIERGGTTNVVLGYGYGQFYWICC